MKSLSVLVCFAILSLCSSANLPPFFKRCDRSKINFNECLAIAIPDVVRKLTERSYKKLGLPSLNPLKVSSISIIPNPANPGPMNFTQNYTNVEVSGFQSIKCSKINMNFDQQFLNMQCEVDWINMQFDYSFNGTFLNLLPIYGNGPGAIYLEKVKCNHTFFFDEYQKNGRTHLLINNGIYKVDAKHLKYNFENLYNGEKLLGDNVNFVMNDNWKEVFYALRPNYEKAFSFIFQKIAKNFFKAVPLDEVFQKS